MDELEKEFLEQAGNLAGEYDAMVLCEKRGDLEHPYRAFENWRLRAQRWYYRWRLYEVLKEKGIEPKMEQVVTGERL